MRPCDHRSVGIIVIRRARILLIKRALPPLGWAAPAGHVDDHGTYAEAATAELREEVGLTAVSLVRLLSKKFPNPCRRAGGTWHRWQVFRAQVKGEVTPSLREVREIVWADRKFLRQLVIKTVALQSGSCTAEQWDRNPGLEPIWKTILEDCDIFETGDKGHG